MWPEKQLQCIQCGDSSFSLDNFEFPSFSYVHDAHPYQWSFMEGHSNNWSTYLSYIYRIRGYLSSRITFPFVICSLNPKLGPFFIIHSSSDHHASRTSPKAHYIIWALDPTMMIIIIIIIINELLVVQKRGKKMILFLHLKFGLLFQLTQLVKIILLE